MVEKFINSEKLIVIYQSAKKQNLNLKNKKNFITFVGKLNKSKGYDIFAAVLKILKNIKIGKLMLLVTNLEIKFF